MSDIWKMKNWQARNLAHGSLGWACALVLVMLCAPLRAELPDGECLKCHGKPDIAQMRPEALAAMVRIPEGQAPVLRNPAEIGSLYVSEDHIKKSAHAGLNCSACHQGIEKLPHNQRLAKLSCGDCHSEPEKALAASVHHKNGKAAMAKPGCTDCHGPTHDITPAGAARTFNQAERMVAACARCHDQGNGHSLVSSYRDNVHGKALLEKGLGVSATCADCHGSHAILPVSDPKNQMAPANAPKTCGRCHEGIENIYFTSIHGQNVQAGKPGASCTNCHSSHGIGKVDKAFLVGVIQECSHCHIKLGETYLKSYHGKATSLGWDTPAVCSSCHGAHDILPASDPRSRVAKANLTQTCGKCHEGANQNFIKYLPHVDYMDPKSSKIVFFVWVAMNVLLLGTLGIFIPHTALWFQRTLFERFQNPHGYHLKPHHERRILRFSPIHRFTHALVIISFMGLVATGFPLKYSYTDWAKEISSWMGGSHVMAILHRVLAIITFAYAGLHFGFLAWFFAFKCPKPRLKYLFGPESLIFSWRDFKDFIAMVRWFLWLGPRPKFDRWVYFEKFDYWGEIWGVFVIGGTGLILWMPMMFTRWLPGWILNCATVIHSIEALLAASVIFLIHFFNTHMRPEKFPIDMVMLTGSMTEEEMKDERPAEYERLVAEGKLEERTVPSVALHWRVLGATIGLFLFLVGTILIVLALKTEIGQFFQ